MADDRFIYDEIKEIKEKIAELEKLESASRSNYELWYNQAMDSLKDCKADFSQSYKTYVEIKDKTEVFIVKQDKTEKKTKIVSLQRGKEKVSRVEKGREFGAMFFPAVDFSIGDVIKYRQS